MERELKAGRLDGLESCHPLTGRTSGNLSQPVVLALAGVWIRAREHLVLDDKLDQCLRAEWRTMCAAREQEWEKDRIGILCGWDHASEKLKKAADSKIKTVCESAVHVMGKYLTIKHIITPLPRCIDPEASLVEAAIEMKIFDTGWLPVCENGRLIGTVTDRDIIIRSVAEGHNLNVITVRRVMSRGVIYCFDDQGVEEAAQIMEMHQIRRLPVLDRRQRLVGIISLGDLAVRTGEENLAGRILERISEPARQAA